MKQLKPLFRTLLPFVMTCSLFLTVQVTAKTPIPDAAKYGYHAISARNMEAFLKFIASDELEGRNTGDRGLNIAAKFLESQYTIAGLTPVPGHDSMLQSFDVIETRTKESSSLSIRSGKQDTTFQLYGDFVILSRHSKSMSGSYPIVFAGFGYKNDADNYDDFKGLDLKGKIVIVIDSTPEWAALEEKPKGLRRKMRTLRRSKAEWAETAGAAALLHMSADMKESRIKLIKRIYARPGQMLESSLESIPQFLVNENLAKALFQNKTTLEALTSQVLDNPHAMQFALPETQIAFNLEIDAVAKTTQNVVAYLQGSDSELKHEAVVLGAHYDHVGINAEGEIYNGADDDGSGTVGILEIARAFAGNKKRPKRSLVFVSHTGEEKGLLGSKYYTSHPQVPLENTIAQLNIDMIGRNETNSVYIIGSNYLSKELHQINEAANSNVDLNLDYKYNDREDPNRFYYRSDHYNYAKHGIPVIFFFSGTHKDYHKPTDTVEKIDFLKMQKITRLVYLTAWKVANLDHDLSKDGLLLEDKNN